MKATQGFVEGIQPLGPGLLLHLRWPVPNTSCTPGQFFLVRCTPNWDIWDPYLRRPLLPALIAPQHIALWLSDATDRGQMWLMAQPKGTRLDMLGPAGHGFELPPSPGHVLILARDEGIGPVWPVMQQALAAGHQVTLALGVKRSNWIVPPALVPVEVEYRLATGDAGPGGPSDVFALLDGLEGWPDQVYAAVPPDDWPRLRAWIERWRPSVEPGFVQVLVASDFICGIGACRACTVELRNGRYARACVHGPVMDLTLLA
ncbi:MAG: hypothetical protein J7M34_04025 [Anaerolineae bacterium]|nr:hypothetical protein [Anaerolineae bacterium]